MNLVNMSASDVTKIDRRGTVRGKCTKCKECDEYETLKDKVDSSCLYCGHVAPDHENLGKDGENTILAAADVPTLVTPGSSGGSSFTTFNFSSSSAGEADTSDSVQVITLDDSLSVGDFLNSVSKNPLKREINSDDVPLPENLPPTLKAVYELKTDIPTEKTKSAMIRKLADKMQEKNLPRSTEACLAVSRKAAKKWSPLKLKSDAQHKGMAKRILKRYRTISSTKGTKTSRANADNAAGVDNIVTKMRLDWEQGIRTPAVFETYMDVLRTTRLQAAVKQSAADHLILYPCLALPSVLLREFEVRVGLKLTEMEAKWVGTLPKILKYMADQKILTVPDAASEHLLTRLVLSKIHLVPVWYKKSKTGIVDDLSLVLKIFTAETPLAETIPKNRSQPQLMTFEGIEEPSYFCYVDCRSPIFSLKNPIHALCHLMSVFYAFNIEWPQKSKMPLWALFSMVVGSTNLIIDNFSQNGKFCSFLEGLGIPV